MGLVVINPDCTGPRNAEVKISIPARSHTFMEIDREIIYVVIFLLLLIQEGLLQVKVCAGSTG